MMGEPVLGQEKEGQIPALSEQSFCKTATVIKNTLLTTTTKNTSLKEPTERVGAA